MVTHVWRNEPVLGSLPDVRRHPWESLANRPLPCESNGSFRFFKISTSDFGTLGMRRQFHAWTYEFLSTVTEDVVHGVHKVVIRSSFSVIQRHKVIKVLIVSSNSYRR